MTQKFLFYPAQLWRHKNHENLLIALAGIKEEYPDIQMVFSGFGKNNAIQIESLITSLQLDKHVRLLGYVSDSDLGRLYTMARALVMPTFFGPTNIPPLEAFTLGCPVAVSNIYGMPEQVGDAALLFDPRDSDDIAQCVVRLWTDDTLCHALIRKGKKRASEWGQKEFNETVHAIIAEIVQRTMLKKGEPE